jgi:hypothetical protein
MAYSDPGAVTGGATPARATWANAVRGDLVDHEARILVLEGIARSVTILTNAQIKALPTTAVQLVAAPASGYRNKLLALSFSTNTSAGAYTNLNGTYVDLHTEPDYLAYGLIDDYSTSPALLIVTTILGGAAQTVYDLSAPNNVGLGLTGYRYVQNIEVIPRADIEAVAITLKADNNGSGNFTGGNAANTMNVTTYYSVEAL